MSAEDQRAVQSPTGARESREDFVKLISIRNRHLGVPCKALCEGGSFKYWCYSCRTPLGGLRAGLGRQCAVCKSEDAVSSFFALGIGSISRAGACAHDLHRKGAEENLSGRIARQICSPKLDYDC